MQIQKHCSTLMRFIKAGCFLRSRQLCFFTPQLDTNLMLPTWEVRLIRLCKWPFCSFLTDATISIDQLISALYFNDYQLHVRDVCMHEKIITVEHKYISCLHIFHKTSNLLFLLISFHRRCLSGLTEKIREELQNKEKRLFW